jgi:hypothetical protein
MVVPCSLEADVKNHPILIHCNKGKVYISLGFVFSSKGSSPPTHCEVCAMCDMQAVHQ